MTNDAELLQEYVRHHSEAAFAELVSRHSGLVYGTALRLVCEPQLAQDVAQSVFVQLACKARAIREGQALAGWLYRVTRCTAANSVRSERRRRQREGEAVNQAELQTGAPQVWQALVPLLDEALDRLGRQDQEAVVLRFLEGRSCREVGEALALSEDAAQKRVSRALEKLRTHFARQGVTVSSALLVAGLEAGALQAPPAGLASALVGPALACASGAGTTGLAAGVLETLLMAKTKAVLLAAVGATLVTTPILVQRHEISRLRKQVALLQEAGTAAIPGLATPAGQAVGTIQTGATNAAAPLFDWRRVESTDYRQYVANLRSIGCPEETIRDIIRADVNQLYEQKKKQYRRGGPKWGFWTSPQDFIRGAGRELWTKMLEFDEERDTVLRTLGIEPDQRKKVAKNLNAFDLMMDFLEDENKRAAILRLRNELEDRLAVRGLNTLDARGIARLYREMEDSIKRLLTPEEAAQYDLRMSSTARGLVHNLAAFEPTEQEFVSIFRLQKAFDDEFSEDLTYGSGAAKDRAVEAMRRLQDQIKQTLSEERYSDYTLAQDDTCQLMYSVAKQAGLGAREVRQIYSVRQLAEQKASQTRSAPNLTAEERAAALERIRQETEKSIEAVLGEGGLAQLRERGNDRALETLLTLPVRTAPTPPHP